MYPDSLVEWFTAHNGTFDRARLTFAPIDNLGWGAFALRDLQVLLTFQNTVNLLRSNFIRSKVNPSFLSPAI
jgi:hypothetical protein